MAKTSAPILKPKFVDSSASLLLDLVRGVAAVIVLMEHWRNLIFQDFHQLPEPHSLFLSGLYILTGCGHQAVVVFFLLSGYFIGGSVLNMVQRNRWLTSDYLLRRLVRLWIVLIPALGFCALWDLLGMRFGHAPNLYKGLANPYLVHNVYAQLQPGVFLSNLFFLQDIYTPTFGSDGALWSLANEFWYYMLFPLIYFALFSKGSTVRRLFEGAAFVAVAALVGKGILFSFPIWLAGVALLRLPPFPLPAQHANVIRIVGTGVYIPIFLALSRLLFLPQLLRDYILTAITFVFLWLLLSAQGRLKPGLQSRFCRAIARFSYSLYALHMPLLVLFAALFVGDTRWLPTPMNLAIALLPLGVALAYAYGVASMTEFQTDRLRARIESLLKLPHPPSPLSSNPREDDAKA